MRKTVNPKIGFKFILFVFLSLSKFRPKKVSDKSFNLFEIWEPNDKKDLEDFLKVKSYKICTNKQKPLLMRASYNCLNDIWDISIFQNNARGVIIKFEIKTDEIESSEVYSFLSSIREKFSNKNDISNLQKSIFNFCYLDKKNLEKYLNLENIDSNIILSKQVHFTYKYYLSKFDLNPERADSNKDEENAKQKNEELNEILNLCKQIAEKFSFSLE